MWLQCAVLVFLAGLVSVAGSTTPSFTIPAEIQRQKAVVEAKIARRQAGQDGLEPPRLVVNRSTPFPTTQAEVSRARTPVRLGGAVVL
jgi:hypothetical protein